MSLARPPTVKPQKTMAKEHETTMKVVACRPIYQGRNATNHSYTIYEVEAQNQQGQLITEKLRSFDQLPIGDTVTVTVVPFESEAWGRAFTLHLKTPKGEDIESRLKKLEAHITELVSMVQTTNERLMLVEERLKKSPST